MTTGERIAARLADIGMTKAELARALGESAQRIGQYVNGKRTPDPDMLARIAAKLGVTVSALQVDGKVSLSDVAPVVRRLCELAGMPDVRASVVGEAAAEALRLLAVLPRSADAPPPLDMAAQAAWHSKQH